MAGFESPINARAEPGSKPPPDPFGARRSCSKVFTPKKREHDRPPNALHLFAEGSRAGQASCSVMWLSPEPEKGIPVQRKLGGFGSAAPCDLEIRARSLRGRELDSFEIEVHSPSGALPYHHHPVSGLGLREPEAFRRYVLSRLDRLGKGLDLDDGPLRAREVRDELVSLGHDLFRELFRGELLAIYRECRDVVSTLLVTTDEPWIPWEILHSGEPGDDFFCARFEMGRWLSGDTTPVGNKRIRKALLLGGDGDLAGAEAEIRDLDRRLDRRPRLEKRTFSPARFRDVVADLRSGNSDLVHYAGHGLHEEGRGGENRLALADRPFRAHHLSPAWRHALRRARPLVVSNSCRAARLEPSLAGLDGWPARWVRTFGCSAFVAPLWTVGDSAGRTFSSAFYDSLFRGRTLAQAVLAGRRAVRTAEPHGLSWLAYTLYAHPNACVHFGAESQPDAVLGRQSPTDWIPALRRTCIAAGPGIEPASSPSASPSTGGPAPFEGSIRALRTLLPPIRGARFLPGTTRASWTAVVTGVSGRRVVPVAALVLSILLWLLAGVEFGDRTLRLSRFPEPFDSSVPSPSHSSPSDQPFADFAPFEPIHQPSTAEAHSDVHPFSDTALLPRMPITPGRLVVLGLDDNTGQPSDRIADAARSVLRARIADLFVLIPEASTLRGAPTRWAEALLGRATGLPAPDGLGPWGSEWILALSVRRSILPEAETRDGEARSAAVVSIRWALHSSVRGEVSARDATLETAPVSSTGSSLEDALDRSLREIYDYLDGGLGRKHP